MADGSFDSNLCAGTGSLATKVCSVGRGDATGSAAVAGNGFPVTLDEIGRGEYERALSAATDDAKYLAASANGEESFVGDGKIGGSADDVETALPV